MAGMSDFSLDQNYPNPFNPRTAIQFRLPERAFVNLQVFNAAGQAVATLVSAQLGAGTHRVDWVASRMPSGMYLCRLQAGKFTQSRKMILVK